MKNHTSSASQDPGALRRQADGSGREARNHQEPEEPPILDPLRASDESYRTIFELASDAIFVHDLETGAILDANRKACELHGCTLEELKALGIGGISDGHPPFDAAHALAHVRRAAEGEPQRFEWLVRRKTGERFWVEVNLHRVRILGDDRILASVRNIDERKQAEAALQRAHDELEQRVAARTAEREQAVESLRQRTQELEAIFRALPDLYFRMEADGTIRDYRAGRSFGLYLPPEEFLGRRVQDVLPPPVSTQIAAALETLARTQDLVHFEYMLPLGDERRDFESRMLPLPDGQVIAIVREITERKKAEDALRASEESYRGLFDNLTELVYIQDLDGRFLNVNEAVVRAYGYTREEIIGQTPDFLGAPGTIDAEAFVATFARAVAGEPQRFEWWGRRKDGSIFPKEVVIKRSRYFGQDVVIAVARDISERVEAEAALRRSEEHFRLLIENASDVVTILGPDGINRYQSPSVERVLGYTPEEMVGTSAFERIHPEDVPCVRETLRAVIQQPGSTQVATFRYRHKDGSWRVLEASGRLLLAEDVSAGVIATSRDVTERKRSEATLRLQKTLLEAQGEASIDGILVISDDGTILSYNQRFVDMWRIPAEVVAARSDEAAIQAVLDQVQDPEAFVARIEELYAHPEAKARDEIALRDGRVFDRYSAPVISSEGDYYGRIWFFRDITAQKRHAEELEQARQEVSHYAKSLERELEFGRQIQQGLLPAALPQPPGWEIAVRFRPVWQVAGDFYDAFELPTGHIGLIIADVSGKGVGAALFMALFQSLLRASAERAGTAASDAPPSDAAILTEAITATNDYITRVHKHAHMFASAFFGVLDPASGTMQYINAGHEPPVVIGAAGRRARLLPTGPALGLLAGASFEVARTTLAPGDVLLAFTDGVTEARNEARAFFTEERLLDLIAPPAPTATRLLDRIEQAVSAFTGTAPLSDDLTLLAVRNEHES